MFHSLHTKCDSTEHYNSAAGSINAKPIKEGDMRGEDDGPSEGLFLNFKQLDQGCICDEIYSFFQLYPRARFPAYS